jgi:peptidoglycan-associated lipoprotein
MTTFRLSALTVPAVLAAAVLSGCSSLSLDDSKDKAPAAPVAAAVPVQAAPAPKSGPSEVELAREAEARKAAEALASKQRELAALQRDIEASGSTVFFDYDSFAIREDAKPVLNNQAKFMGLEANRQVLLEGHADERGSREYNLALGQKRSEAVLKSLSVLGVADSRMEAVSYGKERPAVQGSNEAAWAKNRRVEVKGR